ncbi:hypothetical protein B0H14DRAFT_782338 [Mycena olivaceomarginata]|nr:hypothetical protein B0H14DRAFT_782338 [Mycena olivaceomarginata]
MSHNPRLKIVSDTQRYLPPRNPIDSEMGIVDATTLILLQKMMADSYEHGRVVWKENRARCALTGEAESDDLPCGPNSAQKKVEAWLIEAGLLAPDVADESDETESDAENTPPISPMPPPENSSSATLASSSRNIHPQQKPQHEVSVVFGPWLKIPAFAAVSD